MEDAPHIVIRAFERLVLFPLDLCVLVGGVIFLIGKAWLFGAFLLLMSLLLGMVGQSLPHRKEQTAQQLYSENVGERFGDINHEESKGLAKAVMLSGFLVSVIAAGAALHRELPWYWIVGYFAGAWAVFPLGAILFCLGWARVMEKIHGRERNTQGTR
jgi:membrane protein implicated in regulation of membrane protease activity